VPLWRRVPLGLKGKPRSLVVCVCQQGKAEFLRSRADAVAALLEGGATVCRVDVRGTGETRPGDGRGSVLGLLSCFSWWNFGRFPFNPYIPYYEFYHYYLGAKYAPELG